MTCREGGKGNQHPHAAVVPLQLLHEPRVEDAASEPHVWPVKPLAQLLQHRTSQNAAHSAHKRVTTCNRHRGGTPSHMRVLDWFKHTGGDGRGLGRLLSPDIRARRFRVPPSEVAAATPRIPAAAMRLIPAGSPGQLCQTPNIRSSARQCRLP